MQNFEREKQQHYPYLPDTCQIGSQPQNHQSESPWLPSEGSGVTGLTKSHFFGMDGLIISTIFTTGEEIPFESVWNEPNTSVVRAWYISIYIYISTFWEINRLLRFCLRRFCYHYAITNQRLSTCSPLLQHVDCIALGITILWMNVWCFVMFWGYPMVSSIFRHSPNIIWYSYIIDIMLDHILLHALFTHDIPLYELQNARCSRLFGFYPVKSRFKNSFSFPPMAHAGCGFVRRVRRMRPIFSCAIDPWEPRWRWARIGRGSVRIRCRVWCDVGRKIHFDDLRKVFYSGFNLFFLCFSISSVFFPLSYISSWINVSFSPNFTKSQMFVVPLRHLQMFVVPLRLRPPPSSAGPGGAWQSRGGESQADPPSRKKTDRVFPSMEVPMDGWWLGVALWLRKPPVMGLWKLE